MLDEYEFLHISRTTLVRLLKKLGIDTYAEFKLLMAQRETSAEAMQFDMPEIAKNYQFLIDELKKHDYTAVCQMLHQADTIYPSRYLGYWPCYAYSRT